MDRQGLEFSEAWQDGDPEARWRSAAGHSPSNGARDSGSSILEVEPGRRLPRHTDSAEEIVVVLSGSADVEVGTERRMAHAGDLVVIPKCEPHQVRNAGSEVLRFAAIYSEPDVVTTYEHEVQPNGSRERHTVS